MFRYRLGLLLTLATTLFLSSCDSQGPTDLEPILCHKEIDVSMLKGTGVDLLFITIENHSNDAGPSTTEVSYNTNSSKIPRVLLEVETPSIPSGTDIWISVNFPFEPGTNRFLEPVGKITIIVDSKKVLPETTRMNNNLISDCSDAA